MKGSFGAATVISMIAIIAAISGCGGRDGDAARAPEAARGLVTSSGAEPADPTVHVDARAVEERSFEEAVAAKGQWRSAGQIMVGAPFAGVVDSMSVRPGDRVRRGEVVCRLTTRESRAALRGAEIMARQAHDGATREEAARALDLARREMVRVEVPAPHEGSVIDVAVQPGSEVAESAEILLIQAPDAVVFEARVDPTDAARIRPGERALIVDEGMTEPRGAAVQRILPVAGIGDQATLVWLVPETGSRERPPTIGRFGTGTIMTGIAHRAPAVPDPAIVHDDLTGQPRVAVIDPMHRAIWTPVALGAGQYGWHELRPPALSPGPLVITGGQRGLPDSARVEPKQE